MLGWIGAFCSAATAAAAPPITCQPFATAPNFPTYHIMGHVSWNNKTKALGREAINDCSGIVKFKGVYHVFHQCCQNHWDHVISTDLIHWKRLPPPVEPNRTDARQWYDHSGSYDGGVTLLPESQGGPTIVYDVIECQINCTNKVKYPTGVACPGPHCGCRCWPSSAGPGKLGTSQTMDPPWMGIARAANTSDPTLLRWVKDPLNPINFTGGRDTGGANPGSVWYNSEQKHWNLLALSPNHEELMGNMYRYQSLDPRLHNWTRMNLFAKGPHGGTSGVGGQWFMKLPQTLDGSTPPPGSPTHILTAGNGGAFAFGNYDTTNETFVAADEKVWRRCTTSHGPDDGWEATQVLSGDTGGGPGDEGRVMNIGWAAACGRGSILSLLREIKTDLKHKTLVSNPVPELKGLRTSVIANITEVAVQRLSTVDVPGTEGVHAAASSDVEIRFALPADGSAAIFGVCVLAGPNNSALVPNPEAALDDPVGGPWRPDGLCGDEHGLLGTPLLVNLSAAGPGGNRTGHASLGTTRTTAGHPVALTVYGDESVVDIRVLVDRCVVEAFVMGGRVNFLSMGPTGAKKVPQNDQVPGTKIMLMNRGSTTVTAASVVVSAMGCGWQNPPWDPSLEDSVFEVDGRRVEY